MKTDRDGQALDAIGEAIEATEEPKEEPETHKLTAEAQLNDGREIKIVVPHPFTVDDFESTIVILLNLRAQSDSMVAAKANAGLIVPPRTGLVGPGGRRLL